MGYMLDRRTRRDEDRRPITPDQFFTDEFPRLADKHGHLVTAAMSTLRTPPLTVEIDGSAWTVAPEGDTLVGRRGTVDGALIVTLTPEQFSDWAQNQITLNGFLDCPDPLQFRNGNVADVSAWDSLWIALA